MNLKIYPMTLEDLQEIKDILATDFDSFWNPSILQEELESNTSTYFIAKQNEEIVGFVGMKKILDQADIMNIVTKKAYRKQGVASFLLQNLISICKEKNISSLSLEVREDNLPAIHLYQKFGFQKQGIRKNYYQNQDGIIMTLQLIK